MLSTACEMLTDVEMFDDFDPRKESKNGSMSQKRKIFNRTPKVMKVHNKVEAAKKTAMEEVKTDRQELSKMYFMM